jgi:hypothetical protein
VTALDASGSKFTLMHSASRRNLSMWGGRARGVVGPYARRRQLMHAAKPEALGDGGCRPLRWCCFLRGSSWRTLPCLWGWSKYYCHWGRSWVLPTTVNLRLREWEPESPLENRQLFIFYWIENSLSSLRQIKEAGQWIKLKQWNHVHAR